MTVPLSQPSLPHRPTTAGAARRLACAFGLALALGTAAAPALADGAARLHEIGVLAEQDIQQARTMLVQEGPGLIAGAPYAQRIAYLRLLRRVQIDSGHLRDAYASNEQIVELAEAEGDPLNLALGNLARINRQLDDNDPASALAALETLGARYRELGDPEFRAGFDSLHGIAYSAVGQYDRALQHFQHSLEIVHANPGLWSPREADIRLAMARMYVNARDPDRALAIVREVRAGQEQLPARMAASLCYLEGRALVVRNDIGAGLAAFGRALTLARANGLIALEAHVLGNIANANLRLQRYGPAEAAAREALGPARASAEGIGLQLAEANLGFALFGQGRQQEGLAHVDSVAAQLRQAGALSALGRLLAEKGQALERAGRYREALATVRERETIMKELAQSEREKAISALQEQFKARERAAQIATLRQENAVKDVELHNRGLRQLTTTLGAVLALVLFGVVFVLYKKSVRTGHRLSELNAELAYLSARDPLTGLFNRRSFQDRMRSRTGEAAARPEAADCFTLLDIDHFKRINDEYGHAAGDAVLVEVGRRLREATRESDMVLRWGGEEFLVYSQGVTPAQRVQLVRRILDALAATPVLLDDGTALSISATAGAVSLPLLDDEETAETNGRVDWEQAIALADRALYKGKETGRNRGYLVAGLRRPGGALSDGLQLDLILPGVPALPALPAPEALSA
ncbi:GGDEF domain-containing protein [Massilia sp. YIM B02443]|uniref:GGDEF domain-containing protein n=1 Tax=Massilia sp. YIM B02443 TaxID=3050127 RepID=UPI0025B63216|nr:GGDEF domain-containing protein [Massilia sp. YIM B02443]MDN4038634.1 diguanylate cyclase [Massilia sp. YIM B02443]